MVARSVVAEHQRVALEQVQAVVEKHAPESAERFRLLSPRTPNSIKQPDETITLLAEAVVVLAGKVDELEEANQPRRRGRPPNPPKDK
jgi:hypothetical protein